MKELKSKKSAPLNDTKQSTLRKQTEDKLVHAATIIFSQHGFKGATTRMIAKKANVNIALINRYFDGKSGLFFEVIAQKSKDHIQAPLEYPAQSTLSSECYQFLKLRLEHHIKEVKLFKIVIAQVLTDRAFQKKFSDSILEFENFSSIAERIETLKQQGKVSTKLETMPFIKVLCQQLFAIFFIEYVSHLKPVNNIEEQLKTFIHLYCTPYEI